MGKRNRRRRRETQHRAGRAGGGGPDAAQHRLRAVDDPRFVADGFAHLADALARGDDLVADKIVTVLAAAWGRGGAAVAATTALRAAAGAAWERGWQPADLVHAFGRKQPAPERRLLVRLVTADGAPWRGHPGADAAWLQQLDDLEADLRATGRAGGASAGCPSSGCFVGDWADQEGLGAVDALLRAAQLLAVLWAAPPLPPVGEPPSAWGREPRVRRAPARPPGPGSGAIDERILSRVRALLAKAESTEFVPEAEALTEKAQELMARYAIDHALLSAGAGHSSTDQPVSRRVLIDDPYAKGKANLLAQVGEANRCQAVWCKEFGFSTVFGFPTDLAVTDVLYTSLVSQCSTAMLAASKGVASPRSFRESFVLAFAVHIGRRLRAATATTVQEATADHGDRLLPVLASRDEQVEAAKHQAFPRLERSRVRNVDPRGWVAGQAAAKVAHLDVGKRITR
ncbi:MAG: DUF2786 domain-containing protein [Actinobacteria bacterium]|nr:DUF2786 domain-containing protein [Actinomycetota bacterium]